MKRTERDGRKMGEVPQDDLLSEGGKKIKRRVSFSAVKQIREYPKYLNNTDSSSEPNSDVSRNVDDVSMGNVTLTDSINMSLCETSQLDDSYMPSSDPNRLSDITQLILGTCLPKIQQAPPPIVRDLTNGTDCMATNESKVDGGCFMVGELSMSKVGSSSDALAGIAKDSLIESFSSRFLTSDANCLTKNESVDGHKSIMGEHTDSKVESSIHVSTSAIKEPLPNLFPSRDLTTDISYMTVNESKSIRTDGQESIVAELSISESSSHALANESVKESTMRCSSFIDESIPKFFPSTGQSFGMMEISKMNLGITMYCERDESRVESHDPEMPSHVELSVDPPKFSADFGNSSLGLQNVLPPDNMFLDFSIDKLGTTMDGTNNDVVAFNEEAAPSKSVDARTTSNVGSNSSHLATNHRLPLSSEPAYSLSDSLAAMERVRQAVLDEPCEYVWPDDYEEMMTQHRKNFDLMEFYKEMIRENDSLMDLTTVEFEDSEEQDEADESLGEGDVGSGATELTTQDMVNWLAGLKRKFHLDDEELVEEREVCKSVNCHSFVLQFWTAIFDHLAKSSNKKFQRCLDSLTCSRKTFEKSHKALLDSIHHATETQDPKPDSDNPVVMVTRKQKSELQEKSKEFYSQARQFSNLMKEYLSYDVKWVEEQEINVVIQGSWVITFLLDQSAARSAVIKVARVESGLMSRIEACVRAMAGMPQKRRIESELEHLLKDFLPPEFLESKVNDLTSIVKTLDQISSLHSEASRIVDFINIVNPLQLEEICCLADDVLTFSFFEPTTSLRFSVSTDDFKLPSLCSSSPKWNITRHCGQFREAELRFAIDSVKLDGSYYESVYESICNWLRGFPAIG